MLAVSSCGGSDTWTTLETVPEKAMAPHSSTLAWKIPWMEDTDHVIDQALIIWLIMH